MFVVAKRKTCSHVGCRDKMRHMRHIPRARDNKEVRASAVAMTMVPRTRRISIMVSRGSVHVSMVHTSKGNKRYIGAASSTMQLARCPAKVIVCDRARGSRLRGGRGTFQLLHSGLCSLRLRGGRTSRTTREEDRVNAKSHSRGVEACGFPRKEMASREVGLALRGLSTVLGNSLSRIVSDLVTTSRATGLTGVRR